MTRKPLFSEVGGQGRDAWIAAALAVLRIEGIDGVRIEVLARRLHITKGSFYHHFKDRDELYAAMLDQWRGRLTVDVIDEIERIVDPRERFRQVMHVPYDVDRADRDIDLAVMLWARRDPRAAEVLQDADRLRIEFIARTLAACGVAPGEATPRAVMALAFLRAAPPMDEAGLVACERLLLTA
jgi:AcrR family transcriptional regulator